VSAREWRAVREGETHAASKTSTNNTPESFIVGIGASGALLASAAIVFVTLVGLVSFNVWPTGNEGSVGVNVELSGATPSSAPSAASVPVSAAAGQVASTSVPVGSAVGGNAGAGDNGQGGGAKDSNPKGGVTSPPVTATPPSTGDTGDSGGDTSAPGTATKSPAHPVHPAHPEHPHQNVSDGTNGKDDPGTGDDSGDVVHGKGPFHRPVPQSSSSSSNGSSSGSSSSETGRGRGAPKFRH
jgi:hypothetical protein